MLRKVLLGLFALLVAWPASAQEANPYLSQAKVYYQGLEYEKCLQRLDKAANWKSAKSELAEIEIYNGMCKFNLGRRDDVADHFTLALQIDPEAKLPAFTSPKLVQIWNPIASRFAQSPRRPPPPTDARESRPAEVNAVAATAPKSNAVSNVVLVAGGAVTLLGVGVGLWANSTAEQERASISLNEKLSLQKAAFARGQAADVTIAVGAAMVATGIIFRLLPAQTSPVSVAIGPSNVMLAGTF